MLTTIFITNLFVSLTITVFQQGVSGPLHSAGAMSQGQTHYEGGIELFPNPLGTFSPRFVPQALTSQHGPAPLQPQEKLLSFSPEEADRYNFFLTEDKPRVLEHPGDSIGILVHGQILKPRIKWKWKGKDNQMGSL